MDNINQYVAQQDEPQKQNAQISKSTEIPQINNTNNNFNQNVYPEHSTNIPQYQSQNLYPQQNMNIPQYQNQNQYPQQQTAASFQPVAIQSVAIQPTRIISLKPYKNAMRNLFIVVVVAQFPFFYNWIWILIHGFVGYFSIRQPISYDRRSLATYFLVLTYVYMVFQALFIFGLACALFSTAIYSSGWEDYSYLVDVVFVYWIIGGIFILIFQFKATKACREYRRELTKLSSLNIC